MEERGDEEESEQDVAHGGSARARDTIIVKAKASPKRGKRSRDQPDNLEEETISDPEGGRPKKRDGNSPFMGEAVVEDSKD